MHSEQDQCHQNTTTPLNKTGTPQMRAVKPKVARTHTYVRTQKVKKLRGVLLRLLLATWSGVRRAQTDLITTIRCGTVLPPQQMLATNAPSVALGLARTPALVWEDHAPGVRRTVTGRTCYGCCSLGAVQGRCCVFGAGVISLRKAQRNIAGEGAACILRAYRLTTSAKYRTVGRLHTHTTANSDPASKVVSRTSIGFFFFSQRETPISKPWTYRVSRSLVSGSGFVLGLLTTFSLEAWFVRAMASRKDPLIACRCRLSQPAPHYICTGNGKSVGGK